MIVRSLLVAGLFAALGAGVILRGTDRPYNVDEAWLEGQYPTSVGTYTMVPDPDDRSAGHTYKSDKVTYDTLMHPYGIVSRVLTDGQRQFDVTLIAGDKEQNFHNPLQCFGAQGWTQHWSKPITIPTKSRGDVNATLVQEQFQDKPPVYALYTYEGPRSSSPTNFGLTRDMFIAGLMTGRVQVGTFFRFMNQTPNVSEDQMVRFAHDYLEASPVRPVLGLKS